MKKIVIAMTVIALLITALLLVSCNDEHVHDFKTNVVKPTCVTQGYTEYTCSGCDYAYRDTIVPVKADAHTYGSAYTAKEATCEEEGISRKECTGCGKISDTTIKKKSHTYDPANQVIILAPTCTTPGSAKNECVDCGFTKNETVKATGHSFCDWIVDKAAVCETEEYGSQHRVCDVCGLIEEEAILPHYTSGKGETTAPTCVNIGYTNYVCDGCGVDYYRNFKDATGKHKFGAWEKSEDRDNLECRYCEYCEHYETREAK